MVVVITNQRFTLYKRPDTFKSVRESSGKSPGGLDHQMPFMDLLMSFMTTRESYLKHSMSVVEQQLIVVHRASPTYLG